ncbi:MAG: 2,3-bisphosphoglycerate-independent phosphoglycerate mutase [Bacillota bacterium]|nr:2,3-bisphosphoglycerate-independent phosphoglycerate mutase [Bacillota bacterium]
MKKPTLLLILDGFGCRDEKEGNAIAAARKPNLDRLFASYPHTRLRASGLAVGLPEGQMGNSEVGHLNIGAGRIVYQELTKISKEIEEGDFFRNPALEKAMDHSLKNGSALHLLGLLSDGGVHSHITHLTALIEMARRKGLEKAWVHAFLDGRDVPPRCAARYFRELESYMKETGLGALASIAGRYYAMDRDKRWDRVELAYNALTLGQGQEAATAEEALEAAYARGENDEFVLPTVLRPAGAPPAVVEDGDSVIFFNFRPDRARELTRAFVDAGFSGFRRKKVIKDLCYVCMVQYDAEMPNVSVAFPPQSLKNTLGEYMASLGLSQLHIAETEKYAHVTFFFNGGVEAPNNGEDRVLVPSPQVPTYDLQPEMSAPAVTEAVVERLRSGKYDLVILNYANADMVGHTGVFEAAVKAVETLDACVGRVAETVREMDGQMILTADHGNSDEMLDASGGVMTAHSTSPVPFLVMGRQTVELREGGALADIAPTLLDLMGLPQPQEMTGRSLIKDHRKQAIDNECEIRTGI